jgi:hypothetical protein
VRFKYLIVALLIAIVGTTTTPVTGQEEPLPAIQAKGFADPFLPSVALAVEPIRDLEISIQPTLVDAVRANDYAAFDTLYRDAVRRGEPVGAFAALHDLWTYSVTDPIGAFYGPDLYARLARAYPGYARYIHEYRIVDSNGNVFYPTSETRAFLLDRALEGRAGRVQVAQQSATQASSPAAPPAPRRRASRKTHARVATSPARSAVAAHNAVTPKAPAVVAENPAVNPAVSNGPIVAPTVTVTNAPAVAPANAPADTPGTVPPIAVDRNVGGRGIVLLIIGIVGIGLLAMMLRTPRELPPSIMTPDAPPAAVPPPAADQSSAPVEPLRRPSAAPQPQAPSGKNRANGSRG